MSTLSEIESSSATALQITNCMPFTYIRTEKSPACSIIQTLIIQTTSTTSEIHIMTTADGTLASCLPFRYQTLSSYMDLMGDLETTMPQEIEEANFNDIVIYSAAGLVIILSFGANIALCVALWIKRNKLKTVLPGEFYFHTFMLLILLVHACMLYC